MMSPKVAPRKTARITRTIFPPRRRDSIATAAVWVHAAPEKDPSQWHVPSLQMPFGKLQSASVPHADISFFFFFSFLFLFFFFFLFFSFLFFSFQFFLFNFFLFVLSYLSFSSAFSSLLAANTHAGASTQLFTLSIHLNHCLLFHLL